MTTTTNNLKLFKYDTTNDVNAAFNLNLALNNNWDKIDVAMEGKQATLVSGTNIKTINNTSILGNGNINTKELPSQSGQSGKYLYTDGSNTKWQTITIPQSISPGTVLWFAGRTVPSGFLKCDGSTDVPISSYYALYTALNYGTIYGSTSTTFTIPDIRNRFIEGGTTAGSTIEAGIPNITFKMASVEYINKDSSYWSDQWSLYSANVTTGYHNQDKKDNDCMLFSQQKANSIYGNSSTVQPPAIVLIPIIKY